MLIPFLICLSIPQLLGLHQIGAGSERLRQFEFEVDDLACIAAERSRKDGLIFVEQCVFLWLSTPLDFSDFKSEYSQFLQFWLIGRQCSQKTFVFNIQ